MSSPTVALSVRASIKFLLRLYLKKTGYNTVELTEDINIRPDLIIFDSGSVELAKKFRSENINFLMIYSESIKYEDFENIDYIKEPFEQDILIGKLERIFRRKPDGFKKESQLKSDKKILIADDDEDARRLLFVLLSSKYDVIQAGDGKSLVEQAETEKPDLIISDVVMPELSGWRAIKLVREKLYMKDTPVIFYSSILKDHELYETLKPSGPCEFIYKPYSPGEMLKKVRELLGEA